MDVSRCVQLVEVGSEDTNPVVVCGPVLLCEAALQLGSLLDHVLQAALQHRPGLLALQGQPCQHISIFSISTVAVMAAGCHGFFVCLHPITKKYACQSQDWNLGQEDGFLNDTHPFSPAPS